MSAFVFESEEMEQIKQKAEVFYHSLKSIPCPYLEGSVVFNAKGLRHLKFKSDRVARPLKEQYIRLKLLYLVPEVLKKSHTVQGVWNMRKFEEQKINKRKENILKDVIYYEFIAVIKSVRIKIIIKEVLGGEKHFWSVIPSWGIDKQNKKRILFTGNPDED